MVPRASRHNLNHLLIPKNRSCTGRSNEQSPLPEVAGQTGKERFICIATMLIMPMPAMITILLPMRTLKLRMTITGRAIMAGTKFGLPSGFERGRMQAMRRMVFAIRRRLSKGSVAAKPRPTAGTVAELMGAMLLRQPIIPLCSNGTVEALRRHAHGRKLKSGRLKTFTATSRMRTIKEQSNPPSFFE